MSDPGLVPLEEAERAASAVGQRTARRFRPIEAVQLHGLAVPERRWLVPGWIPDRSVTLLGGDGGTGKSLLALQLLVAAALGKPWLGMPVPRRRALALFCEDDAEEVHVRAAAIAEHYGVALGDLEGAFWDARSGKENVLMSFGERDGSGRVAPLFEEVRAFVRENGVQLLVVDTLADSFGGNENFRAQARAFVNLLRGLAVEAEAAVILTAHPSVAGQASGSGLSGSTAWNNSVRSRLYLTRPPAGDGAPGNPDERVLKRVKSNYSSVNDELRIAWQEGVFTAKARATGIIRLAEQARIERAFLEALRMLTVQGRHVSDRKSSTFAPAVLARQPTCAGLTAKALTLAMERLLTHGRIKVVSHGPPSRARYHLVEVVQ